LLVSRVNVVLYNDPEPEIRLVVLWILSKGVEVCDERWSKDEEILHETDDSR
jgi:hypothetical protein